MERNLLDLAIANFNMLSPAHQLVIDGRSKKTTVLRLNGTLFQCIYRPQLQTTGMLTISDEVNKGRYAKSVIVVTNHLSESLLDRARECKLNVLDTAGNCHINDMDSMFVYISGRPRVVVQTRTALVFRASGVNVIFYLIQHEGSKIPSYHVIASAVGVSTGTVKDVVDKLLLHNYLLKTDKGVFIINKVELTDLWVTLFNRTIRPRLWQQRFRWQNPDADWIAQQTSNDFLWGGECAAYLKNQYMTPAVFEVYTKKTMSELVQQRGMVPDPNGDIFVMEKFWQGTDS